MAYLKSFKNPAYAKYCRQKLTAKYRGIEFDISFPDWVDWWEEQLGPQWLQKRGLGKDKYVMGRLGDTGSYRLDNIECITQSKNMTDSNHRKPRGGGPIRLGCKHTNETIEKMRLVKLGNKNPFYGKKHTDETRQKMSKNSRWRNENG